MILDVGCGDRPKGTVNVDLNIKESSHLFESQRKINPNRATNFVQADAYHLPFRNNSFDKVLCHHTLEHLDKPCLALKEMMRVASNILEVIVPFRWHETIQNRFMPKRKQWAETYHKFFFTKKQLETIFKEAGLNPLIRYSWKLVTSLKYFNQFQIRNYKQLILYGILDLLPPTPGELIATTNKIDNPIARAR